jgi:septum formation protein
MARLVLASASPRRRELLTQAGFSFEVRPAHVNEDVRGGEDPVAYVTRLAREKAEAVFNALASHPGSEHTAPHPTDENLSVGTPDPGHPEFNRNDLLVLGADTTVTLDGQILGKPVDADDAKRMLGMLAGRTHRVITGVAVVSAQRTEVAAEVTAVRFREISAEEIAAYVASGEPMDKAGAYGIQGLAAKWIPRIEGCYFNVVGLPLALVSTMLENRD